MNYSNHSERNLFSFFHSQAAATGITSGVILGGVLGWLAGRGALMISGTQVFTAAGPALSMLFGIGVFGILGGVTGGLIGFEIIEDT